jgi:hypothetical protein
MVEKVVQAGTIFYEFDDGERGSISAPPDTPNEDIEDLIGRPLPSDPAYEQQQQAGQNLGGLFTGLRQLDPEDAAYAAYGRSWAVKNGESQETILAIVDRQTAGQYILAQTEWQNLTPEAKQFHIDHIDAMMKMMQGVIRAIL